MIPLVGAKVEITSGIHQGSTGVVEMVDDGRDVLGSLDSNEAYDFIRSQKARLGARWIEKWFKADVRLISGASIELEAGQLRVTDGLIRPDRYRTV